MPLLFQSLLASRMAYRRANAGAVNNNTARVFYHDLLKMVPDKVPNKFSMLLDADRFAKLLKAGQFDNEEWPHGQIPFKFADVLPGETFQPTIPEQHTVAAKSYVMAFKKGFVKGLPVAVAIGDFGEEGAGLQRALAANAVWHYSKRQTIAFRCVIADIVTTYPLAPGHGQQFVQPWRGAPRKNKRSFWSAAVIAIYRGGCAA